MNEEIKKIIDINSNLTFEKLFIEYGYNIVIPDYQRAYSWEKKQIEQYVEDLIEMSNDKYYLGHYIFEFDKESNTFEIIDGQQRITSFVLFVLAIKRKFNIVLADDLVNFVKKRFLTISYDRDEFEIIVRVILEGKKDDLKDFQSTNSIKKVVEAIEEFEKNIPNHYKENDLVNLIQTIRKASVSFHSTEDKSVAVQIFELQNSRGIPLNLMEKVKAKLMKEIYLLDSYSVDEKVAKIQECFAEIYRLEDKLKESSFRGGLTLDRLMLHHLRVINDGTKIMTSVTDSNIYLSPPIGNNIEESVLEYLSLQIKNLDNKEQYILSVVHFFKESIRLICNNLIELDKSNPLIGDCYILDSNNSLEFYLILLHKNILNKVDFKKWEQLLFTRDFHLEYYRKSHNDRDNFKKLFREIVEFNGIDISSKIDYLLKHYLFYGFRGIELKVSYNEYIKKHKDNIRNGYGFWSEKMTYLLYKYEIECKDHNTRKAIRKIFKTKKTLEHILPQSWDKNWIQNIPESEHEVFRKNTNNILNGIGNLLILSSRENSSENNDHPKEKVYNIKLGSYGDHNFTKSQWEDPTKWESIILNRGEKIYQFLLDYFSIKIKDSEIV